jgi:hypothetical protein
MVLEGREQHLDLQSLALGPDKGLGLGKRPGLIADVLVEQPGDGLPKAIRVDLGSEFVFRDLDLWAYAKGVTLDFSRPGDAREKLEARRTYYCPASQRPSVYVVEAKRFC